MLLLDQPQLNQLAVAANRQGKTEPSPERFRYKCKYGAEKLVTWWEE